MEVVGRSRHGCTDCAMTVTSWLLYRGNKYTQILLYRSDGDSLAERVSPCTTIHCGSMLAVIYTSASRQLSVVTYDRPTHVLLAQASLPALPSRITSGFLVVLVPTGFRFSSFIGAAIKDQCTGCQISFVRICVC